MCTVRFSNLLKIDAVASGHKISAIVDSDTEIVFVNCKNYIFDNQNTISKVQLSSRSGISVIADVKRFPTQLNNKNMIKEDDNINLICTVVDLQCDIECWLTTEAYHVLLKNFNCQYDKCADLPENEIAEANALSVYAVTEV